MFNVSIIVRRWTNVKNDEDNGAMKSLWSLLVAGLLVGCAPDRTLETLFPARALAVAVVDHPALLQAAVSGSVPGVPWSALDTQKPWGAAVLPGRLPQLVVAVALANRPGAWPEVRTWARTSGGLDGTLVGRYAVFTSPDGGPFLAGPRFDLSRVRGEGDLVQLYVDLQNLPGVTTWPWVASNLAGLRWGLGVQGDGVHLHVSTDWLPTSAVAGTLRKAGAPADVEAWSGFLGDPGAGWVVSLPPSLVASLGSAWGDRALARQWSALVPALGPRLAWQGKPRPDGSWDWAAVLESSDPQAVRQGLKALVASGELQQHFSDWALDPDTPLIYQDLPGTGDPRARLTLGPWELGLVYGRDRVRFAANPEGGQLTLGAGVPKTVEFADLPAGVRGLGTWDGGARKARGALGITNDGNLSVDLWVAGGDVRAWVEWLPGEGRRWLLATEGWFLGRP